MRALLLAPLGLAALLFVPVASAGCTTTYAAATEANAGPVAPTEVAILTAWLPSPITGLPVVAPATLANVLSFPTAQVPSTLAYVACVV